MMRKLTSSHKGFTLVEVLIVVALIAILAVIALVTINPFEAQKRTRDARRLKDMGTLQGVIEQYISDNPDTAAYTAESTDNSASISCGTDGWTGIDLCTYANTIPIDPLNRSAEYANTDGDTTDTGVLRYFLEIDTDLRYTICTRFESGANGPKLTSDGRNDGDGNWFSVYSSTSGPACPNS